MRTYIFAIGFMGLMVVATGTNAFAYSPYFSIGGGYYDSHVNISRGTASVSSNGLSLSAVAGVRLNQYFSAEVNGMINQLRIESAQDKNDLTFVGVMPGVRMGVKIMGVFYPYVGASIGPSFVINEIGSPLMNSRHTTTTVAYQGRIGLMISLFGGAGLDMGVRYMNQGRLDISGADYATSGNVTSFNYYITASYGF